MKHRARPTALAALAALATLVACHTTPATGPHAPAAADAPAVELAKDLAAAFVARDAYAVAAKFTEDATMGIVGDRVQRGRGAVSRDVTAILTSYRDARLEIGRIWIDAPVAVIEIVFRGERGDRTVGVAGAVVVRFGRDRGRGPALVRDLRLYFDFATLLGQIDPHRLPDGAQIRPLEPAPQAGTFTAAHTPAEAKNLEIANQIWSALSAHDVDAVMAPSHEDYIYYDYAAPRAKDKAGTHRLVTEFLGAVEGFTITEKPTQLAAGDYVLTEVVEHAAYRGKPIVLHALDIKRFSGGRVLEEWQYSNYFEILTQVFGQPAPGLH
jgi:hypothetical protein